MEYLKQVEPYQAHDQEPEGEKSHSQVERGHVPEGDKDKEQRGDLEEAPRQGIACDTGQQQGDCNSREGNGSMPGQ